MLRKIFLIGICLIVVIYMTAAFCFSGIKSEVRETPVSVIISINDSTSTSFITEHEIKKLLQVKNIYPEGKQFCSISCQTIEEELEKNVFIEKAICYRTPSDEIRISIIQRRPILRIISDSGLNCFIDEMGYTLPIGHNAVHLPIATGNISQTFITETLYPFARLICEDDFWNKQIQQINVTESEELEIIPRIGDHILFLGKPLNIPEKLKRIRTFYDKGLSRVGWNKYSHISVEFDNQVICKRRDTNK